MITTTVSPINDFYPAYTPLSSLLSYQMGPLFFAFISPHRPVDWRKGRSLSSLTIWRDTEFRLSQKFYPKFLGRLVTNVLGLSIVASLLILPSGQQSPPDRIKNKTQIVPQNLYPFFTRRALGWSLRHSQALLWAHGPSVLSATADAPEKPWNGLSRQDSPSICLPPDRLARLYQPERWPGGTLLEVS